MRTSPGLARSTPFCAASPRTAGAARSRRLLPASPLQHPKARQAGAGGGQTGLVTHGGLRRASRHSGFSFLDGASDPEELVAEASRLGLSGLALTDHHGLYGVVRFAEAARAVGSRRSSAPSSPLIPTVREQDPRPAGEHLVLLAAFPRGLRHLATMLAEAHLAAA